MSIRYNQNKSPLVRIVYSQKEVNGKVELVPLELYADGSLKRASWLALFLLSENQFLDLSNLLITDF